MLLQTVHYFPTFFFFNDTATTEIYTLSLHDALPICRPLVCWQNKKSLEPATGQQRLIGRSEEHTSELQSYSDLVCRLLLEKKNNTTHSPTQTTDEPMISNIRVAIALKQHP